MALKWIQRTARRLSAPARARVVRKAQLRVLRQRIRDRQDTFVQASNIVREFDGQI